MKNEEVRMKNEGEDPKPKSPFATSKRPEPGADSQLHNYNVMLSRLGDLFGDEDEEAAKPKK